MGFITNQWLKGAGERDRKFRPVIVSVRPENTSDEWSTANKVVAGIKAAREDDDYQCVFFTAMDLDGLLPAFTQATNLETRKKIAFDILHKLDDADLLSFLSELLPSRAGNRI